MTTILPRVTGEWATWLHPDAILAVCREIGSTAKRDRLLPSGTTIQVFLLPRLHGHTACPPLPPLSGLRFTAAASCHARARRPWRCFALLLERCSRAVPRSAVDDGRWHGPRTFLVEGAGGSRPESSGPPGRVRPIHSATAGVRRSRGAPRGPVPCRH